MITDKKALGDKIRKERLKKHMTQTQLACLMSKSKQAIYQWEKGICEPSGTTLIKLNQILQILPSKKINAARE